MKRNRSFFTLLELLIVISIIALLATMLFPAVTGIKNSALRMNCFNKTKNIAIENQRFSQTHDGRVAYTCEDTLYEDGDKLYSANQLEWYMWLAADGMGQQLRTYLDDAAPTDPWGMAYESYRLPGAAVERTNNGSDGRYARPNLIYMPENTSGQYFYNTASLVFWNFVCDEAPPSPTLSRQFTQIFDMLYEKDKFMGVYPISAHAAIGGSFAINGNIYNFDKLYRQEVACIVDNLGRSSRDPFWDTHVYRNTQTQANIKSPSIRAYIAETSPQDTNDDSTIKLRFSTTGIFSLTDIKAFIPGFGAAGRGRDLYEGVKSWTKTNFQGTHFEPDQKAGGTPSNLFKTTEEWNKVTQESYDANILHLEEGRHSGYTLHGYFDGHAEMLSAATVGKLQTQAGSDWIKYLTGPYGDPTIAGEWK